MGEDQGDATPQATVVITNYNYGRFLEQSIRSAIDQVGVDVEVIVVDDGSDDESHEVIQRYEQSITAIFQPHLGQGAAINAGFRIARGDVILFLDADDFLDNDIVRRCCDELAADRDAVRIQFVLRCVDGRGDRLGITVPPDPAKLPRGDCRAAVLSHGDDLPWQPTSGNAFRASALRRILPMPADSYRTCADHHLSNLSPLLGRVLVLDRPGGAYRRHDRNADHRPGFDLERTRGIMLRTLVTHEGIRKLAEEEHLIAPGELAIRSATLPAIRLVSLRLSPESHPIAGDRRIALVADGLRAAAGRRDVHFSRRVAMGLWFVVTAVAPRELVRSLAERTLRSSTQGKPSARRGRRRARLHPTSDDL